ncbi:hypothetical protein KIW84_033243 [Lathyrus oleraceus]|uniref:Uncharacterized protein n=1 Tax=Pisum sativum TaxID=3888 RepID=A0A9D4XWC9_PEA|nr:hypothetical protein KIW84_033243 [Pisum sativum]
MHAWHNVHRKGRSELGPCNCVALEAYTTCAKKRALELKISYACERPMAMVVVEPLTLPNQDVEELEHALAKMKFFFRQMSYWLFFCASSKMTHRYNTRANQLRIMEHLEQENRELKDEIARLTAMMEFVLDAQSQSSPKPATPPPPQRTIISEVVTSTVPATQFTPTMPSEFP